MRRVPPPICNALRPDPDASGDGRVLVENSDTASPGSQPMGISQSQSQSQDQGQGKDPEGAGSQESQMQQSQPPSKLRNEIERARSRSAAAEERDQDVDDSLRGGEGVAQESQPAAIEEDVSMAEAGEGLQAAASQELLSEASQKSRQSLSYKGDSQSQDKSAEEAKAPAPPTEVVAPGTERGPVFENDSKKAPAAEALEENLQEASPTGRPEHRSPSPRPPSPMQVDGWSLPAPATAPTWAVMGPSPSPDDDDDSLEEEANVDELLSDPIEVDQAARPPVAGAKTRRISAGGAKGKRRLDPDDARTAAMVDQYVSAVREKDGGKVAGRANATTTGRASPVRASRSRQPTPHVDRVLDDRATKQRKKKGAEEPSLPQDADVPMTEESSKQSKARSKGKQRERDGESTLHRRQASPAPPADEPSPSSQPSGHDPKVWAAPTFMLKPHKPKKDAPPPASKADTAVSSTGSSKITGRRRPASGSPQPEGEGRPAKKQKTSSAAVPVVGPPFASSTEQQQDGRSGGKSGAAAKAPSERPAQDSRKKHPQTSAPALALNAGSDSRNVKYVDLRAASRSSSRSSSRAPPAGSRGSSVAGPNRRPDEQSTIPGKRKAPVPSAPTEKGTASSSGPQKMPLLPVMSGAKTASSRNGTRGASALPREESSSSRRTPTEDQSHARPRTGEADEDDWPLLGGYRVSLELVKEPGGPPVMDWKDVLRTLRRTGSYRRRASSSTRERGRDG